MPGGGAGGCAQVGTRAASERVRAGLGGWSRWMHNGCTPVGPVALLAPLLCSPSRALALGATAHVCSTTKRRLVATTGVPTEVPCFPPLRYLFVLQAATGQPLGALRRRLGARPIHGPPLVRHRHRNQRRLVQGTALLLYGESVRARWWAARQAIPGHPCAMVLAPFISRPWHDTYSTVHTLHVARSSCMVAVMPVPGQHCARAPAPSVQPDMTHAPTPLYTHSIVLASPSPFLEPALLSALVTPQPHRYTLHVALSPCVVAVVPGPQVMQLFGGGAGAAAGAGAGGAGGAAPLSSGRCRYKGGTTVDVSVGYHTFEVTSFRGGTRDPGEEAEWRDAGAGRGVWVGGLCCSTGEAGLGDGRHAGSAVAAPCAVQLGCRLPHTTGTLHGVRSGPACP